MQDRDAAREGLSALQIATDAREAEFNQYIDQLDAKLHTCEQVRAFPHSKCPLAVRYKQFKTTG